MGFLKRGSFFFWGGGEGFIERCFKILQLFYYCYYDFAISLKLSFEECFKC